ncbi:MAG: methylated-DNA--[protein]-cysteine S-methyltransferase [Anaerolineae bacterium]|nr:methylated-DNA--[protein]-cysteine S-methyltransferase [Anaerolineae bacterium]
MAIVWQAFGDGVRVRRIHLPAPNGALERRLDQAHGHVTPGTCEPIALLAAQMGRFLQGEDVLLPLDNLDLGSCPPFARRVLLAEYAIPRGCISTYGRIARHLGTPKAARAVGNALARNPFPIVIPCHRAVRADGSLGGYQGGLAMKAALLGLEGISVCDGRVHAPRLFYDDDAQTVG